MAENPTDNLLETTPGDLLAQVQNSAISLWSESKKEEFVELFQNRVRVARFLLIRTAAYVASTAERRRFISQKHLAKMRAPSTNPGQIDEWFRGTTHLFDGNAHRYCEYQDDHRDYSVAGRSTVELKGIARERSLIILDELPPLHQVVKIIDPETAKKLLRKEEVLKEGEELRVKVEAASEPIVPEALDQSMPLSAFLKLIRDRDTERKSLIEEMNDLGKEARELEEHISKKLFVGLPGLSEAVIDVVKTHLDRATALDATSRRVEEQVKFGDNEAALTLLQHFEQDEKNVSAEIKAQFNAALEKLKLSVKSVSVKGAAKGKSRGQA